MIMKILFEVLFYLTLSSKFADYTIMTDPPGGSEFSYQAFQYSFSRTFLKSPVILETINVLGLKSI